MQIQSFHRALFPLLKYAKMNLKTFWPPQMPSQNVDFRAFHWTLSFRAYFSFWKSSSTKLPPTPQDSSTVVYVSLLSNKQIKLVTFSQHDNVNQDKLFFGREINTKSRQTEASRCVRLHAIIFQSNLPEFLYRVNQQMHLFIFFVCIFFPPGAHCWNVVGKFFSTPQV